MECYDFKVFSRVLRRFTTKFAPLAHTFWCAKCKQIETGKPRVDTPESWHTVCLIFGRNMTLTLFQILVKVIAKKPQGCLPFALKQEIFLA